MTRPRTLLMVSGVTLLIAATASYLVYRFLLGQTLRTPRGVAVLAAAADIPVGSRLQPAMVRSVVWPKEGVAPGALSDPAKLAGRVAVRPISAGDAITEAKLVPQAGAGGGIMTYLVPDGHRAVTAAVNEVAGVAGFITPGSRVDVVVTTPRPGNKEEIVSKIVLENVPVLATGQITDQKEGKPVVVPTVTLDLAPDDAEKLVVSASNKGSLQLLLRNIADSGHVQSRGATIARVLTGLDAPPAAPAKRKTAAKAKSVARVKPAVSAKAPAPPTFLLEIVRGSEKTARQYSE
jgi:pilus assembly protein CpaB